MLKSNKCSYWRNGKEIKKRSYLRPEEALKKAKKINEKPNLIHVMVAYKCTECLKFHIGKSWKTKGTNGLYNSK